MESAKRLYKFEGSSEHIEQQLTDLMISDKESEDEAAAHSDVAKQEAKKAFFRGGPFLLIAFLAYNGMISRGTARDAVVVLSFAIGAGIFFYFISKAFKASSQAMTARRGDIDDRLYEGLGRLHSYLKADCHDNANYQYELDFRSGTDQSFVVNSKPYRNGSETYYEIPKLKAQAKLRDGTVLYLQVEYHTRARAYSKTNARGKVKSKYKTKNKDVFKVSFKFPGELGVTTLPEERPQQGMALQNAAKSKLKVEGNRVSTMFQRQASYENFDVNPALQLAVSTLARVKAIR